MSNWKLPKWAVVVAAALLFLPLVADWVAPGDGARLAAGWLGPLGITGPTGNDGLFPLWGWLVGLAGRDVAALGAISAGAGLVCVWFVAAIVGAIFCAAVRGAKAGGIKGEEGNYAGVESAAVLLAGLGFALTPGFLVAATRISPLMVALVPGLGAMAIVAGGVCQRPRSEGAAGTVIERMKKGKGRLLLAVGLVGYSAFELVLARRVFLSLAFPALGVWLAVGVMPALVIAKVVALHGRCDLGVFRLWRRRDRKDRQIQSRVVVSHIGKRQICVSRKRSAFKRRRSALGGGAGDGA